MEKIDKKQMTELKKFWERGTFALWDITLDNKLDTLKAWERKGLIKRTCATEYLINRENVMEAQEEQWSKEDKEKSEGKQETLNFLEGGTN